MKFKVTLLASLVSILSFTLFGPQDEAWSAPKGKLVVAQAGDPTTLDPQMNTEIPSAVVHNNVYDYLVKRVFKEGKIVHEPMLATSWEMANDTTWVFHLRKGVKFHNGEEFNAEAVKYTTDRMLNPAQKARRRIYVTFIDRVDILDPYTVKITTKGPIPFLISNIGYALAILPPKYTKEKGDAYVGTHPVGTGPFKFVRWIKDEEIVLEANENYWGGSPRIKSLVFKPIPEDSTRVAALLGGNVDIIKNAPIHVISMINKSNRAKVMWTPAALIIRAVLDTLKEGSPLRDRRVRQAINYGVNKEAIVKHVLEGYGAPMASPLNPGTFGYDPNLKPYPYDPEKAKALLKEAGYGSGLTLTFNSPAGRYAKDKEFAEAIADQLSKVGIRINLKVHEWGTYMKMVYSPEGAGDMWTWGWGGTSDADSALSPLLYCGVPLSKYCNKEVDKLLDQARGTMDVKKREKIYHQALKLIHEDGANLFLHQGVDVYGVSQRVENWKPNLDEVFTLAMHQAAVKD